MVVCLCFPTLGDSEFMKNATFKQKDCIRCIKLKGESFGEALIAILEFLEFPQSGNHAPQF